MSAVATCGTSAYHLIRLDRGGSCALTADGFPSATCADGEALCPDGSAPACEWVPPMTGEQCDRFSVECEAGVTWAEVPRGTSLRIDCWYEVGSLAELQRTCESSDPDLCAELGF